LPVKTSTQKSITPEETITLKKNSPDSSGLDLRDRVIPSEVLEYVSEEAATFYQIMPVGKSGEILEMGMVDPDDLRAKEALRFILKKNNLKAKVQKISPADFREALKQYRSLHGEVEGALRKLEKELSEKGGISGEKEEIGEQGDDGVFRRMMAEAPITKIVATILRHAQEGRASDIHIEPGDGQLRVRFRVDGVLHTSLLLPEAIQNAVISRVKILADLKIDETRVPQDGRFHSKIGGRKIDFRVSTLPTSFGEKAVLRLLDASSGIMDLETLGLWGRNLRLVQEEIRKPFGLILLTGPTGSGKTTTLYAIMKILNQEVVNIISLEDPIEYFIDGVNQSQIRPEIGYTFASGLRSILRQDPNVIMVGEIRDEETADLSIHASLTGHIVLSTLHTNNAVGVIPRLADMGVEPFLMPSALSLSIAQRLVKKLCPICKREVETPEKIKKMIEREFAEIPESSREEARIPQEIKSFESPGCKECGGKGTKGRLALFEVLAMTPELEKIIVEDFTEAKIEQEARRQGMISMRQDGFMKVVRGDISVQEVIRVTKPGGADQIVEMD